MKESAKKAINILGEASARDFVMSLSTSKMDSASLIVLLKPLSTTMDNAFQTASMAKNSTPLKGDVKTYVLKSSTMKMESAMLSAKQVSFIIKVVVTRSATKVFISKIINASLNVQKACSCKMESARKLAAMEKCGTSESTNVSAGVQKAKSTKMESVFLSAKKARNTKMENAQKFVKKTKFTTVLSAWIYVQLASFTKKVSVLKTVSLDTTGTRLTVYQTAHQVRSGP